MAADPGRQWTTLTTRVRAWTAASVGAAVIAAGGLTVMLQQQASADGAETTGTSSTGTSSTISAVSTTAQQSTAAQAPVATRGDAHTGSGGW